MMTHTQEDEFSDIIIVGAGGLGREVFAFALHCIQAGERWRIRGFIDDNLNALDNFNYPVGIISSIKDYIPKENDRLLLGIGIPCIKKKVVNFLLSKGGRFETLIHPSVILGYNVSLGDGVVIFPYCVISADVKIGDWVYINSSCTLDHDTKVGAFSTICCGCDLTGEVKVGKEVFISSHVTTTPRSIISNNVFVGINSFVYGNIESNTKVLGNPASVKNYINWKDMLDKKS